MSDIFQLLENPVMFKALLKLLAIYAVFMAFAGALPMPDATSGKFYKFCFHFVNGLSFNISRIAHALKVPGASEAENPTK